MSVRRHSAQFGRNAADHVRVIMTSKPAAALIALAAAATTLAAAAPANATPSTAHSASAHAAGTPRVEGAAPGLGRAVTTATTRSGGVTVTVPSTVTVYNKAKARVVPKVRVASGVTKQVTSTVIRVYSGKHRIRIGHSARLPIGKYTQTVTVRYHSYKLVTKTKQVAVKTLHDAGYPDGTTCTITAVSSLMNNGVNDMIEGATCTNTGYPGQSVAATWVDLDDVPWGDGTTNYTVGQVVTTAAIYFASYYSTSYKTVPYQAKSWTSWHTFTTRKRALTIRDGGHQRVYHGSESGNTPYFTVPRHWTGTYAFDCSGFGMAGNWILDLHKRGSYDDVYLRNIIAHSGSHGWRFTGAGTFRFEAITECDWAIVVRWR